MRRPIVSAHSVLATLVVVLAVWLASGLYKVQPDQVGLVLRFGRWIDTRQPGLNYHLPYPIEIVLLPRVTAINQLKIGNGTIMQMLTGDENIVEAQAVDILADQGPGEIPVQCLRSREDSEGRRGKRGAPDYRPQPDSVRTVGSATEDRGRSPGPAPEDPRFLRRRNSRSRRFSCNASIRQWR